MPKLSLLGAYSHTCRLCQPIRATAQRILGRTHESLLFALSVPCLGYGNLLRSLQASLHTCCPPDHLPYSVKILDATYRFRAKAVNLLQTWFCTFSLSSTTYFRRNTVHGIYYREGSSYDSRKNIGRKSEISALLPGRCRCDFSSRLKTLLSSRRPTFDCLCPPFLHRCSVEAANSSWKVHGLAF